MEGFPTDFWGKLAGGRGQPVTGWHPLTAHCVDVGACVEALLTRTLLGPRIARIGGLRALSAGHVAKLSTFGVLHDAGKPNAGFQRRALPGRPRIGHVGEVVALFNPLYPLSKKFAEALDLPTLSSWAVGGGGKWLLLAAIGHHGEPCTSHGRTPDPSLWGPSYGKSPFEFLHQLLGRTKVWFPEAWTDPDPLPSNPAFQHAFAGLVMLADWLGSDTRFFPHADVNEDRITFARAQAGVALEAVGLDVRQARMSLPTVDFARISPHPPRPEQNALLGLTLPKGPSITVLEAETGSGKTEAALAYALRFFREGLVDGLYFALPTRVAASEIFERVHGAVARAFPDPSIRPPVVQAVPGYLRVDEFQGKKVGRHEVAWLGPTDTLYPDVERPFYRGWAAESPKRYLVGPIVVGTVDQALLSSLGVHHAHLRSTALLRHLLIVDEVHASDDYMMTVLQHVLGNHRAAGGHALLLSATLGAKARERLLGESDMPYKVGSTYPYAAITRVEEGAERITIPVSSEGPRKTVRIDVHPWAEDVDRVSTFALQAAGQGAKVLVVRNTVAACVATQLALESAAKAENRENLLFSCAKVSSPHHARYAPRDRKWLDRHLREALGKTRPPGGLVVVTTQTSEQSLDLDADLLITDLCPMDVFLQRVGRLYRHDRPVGERGMKSAQCVVLRFANRDLGRFLGTSGRALGPLGFGRVYPDLTVLEATLRLLERTPLVRTPQDCRRLVEEATHPETVGALVQELGEAWRRHTAYVDRQERMRRSLAKDHGLLRRDVGYDSDEVIFHEGRVSTRFGLQDVLARFEAPSTGPFGLPFDQISIPSWLCEGVDFRRPPKPTLVQEASGVLTFLFGARAFRYDRLGLRHVEAIFSS